MKKSLLFLAAALTFGLAVNAQTVFTEDFESVTVSSQTGIGSLPTGWVLYEDNLTNNSNYSALGKSWCVVQFESGEQMALSCSYTTTGSACDRWLVSPQISIPATGYALLFDLFGLDDRYPESLKVMVSTSGTNKTDFTTTILDVPAVPSGIHTRFIDLSDYANQSIHIAFINYGANGYYVGVDNVNVTVVPDNGIKAVSATTPSWTSQSNYINVALTVSNRGSNPLTSFDISYYVNGGDEQNINVTGLNIDPFTSYTYNFSATTAELGLNTVNITVSNPNGETDGDETDNTVSCSTNVYDPANYADNRVVLLEHFTTARCPNCPPAHETLDAAVEPINANVAWVAHHVGYYTDNMTINESNQIMTLFNDNGSTYAPAVMIDRNPFYAGAENPGPVFFPSNGVVNQHLANAVVTPAKVSVNISDINYDEMTRQLSVKVSGTFHSDLTFGSARLSLYVTQDSIIGTQSGVQGNYQHDHVIRACISNVWGDENIITATTAGSNFEHVFTYTLPYKVNANKARLVAFVNNYASNVNDRLVYNAAKTDYLLDHADPTLGINAVEASINVVTYPNPATEMAYVTAEGTIRSYEMVDALGRKVMNQENVNADVLELNVSNFSAGVYFISVTTDKGVATQRLTVVK